LALLLNSEAHRKALLRILNQSYVSQNITVANLEHIVGGITAADYISFTDEEIPPGGRGIYKALHITTRCKDHMVAKVLIDNGSALNVMPLSTLTKLPVDHSMMKASQLIVRAFDGTRREVVGEMTVPIIVGPVEIEILFQVMDIAPAYSYLLGRPWIHMAGAVPSSLHQKVKFRVENQMISVSGEEDIMVMQPPNAPYIEAMEEAVDCSFRSFEIVEVTQVKEGVELPKPHFSDCLNMQVKMTVGKGCRAGKGMGCNWWKGVGICMVYSFAVGIDIGVLHIPWHVPLLPSSSSFAPFFPQRNLHYLSFHF